ncbi:MAG: M23 family metallopeptidase [Chlorobi bacterium]|nr:M23 family metallopeptidase [Chlorobiota bacterium]
MAKLKSDKKWYYKLRSKYRLVIFNDETFQERLIFRLTRLNVFSVFLSLGIIFTALTFILIIYTPIKEYIPGYPSSYQNESIIRLNILADSLETELKRKDLFFENIKNIVEGKDFGNDSLDIAPDDKKLYDTITLKSSAHDSLLRLEFETQNLNNLYLSDMDQSVETKQISIKNLSFYPPIDGIVTSKFDLGKDHYGVDVVAKHNSAVTATLDGTVIFTAWTLETGYVIAVQHRENLVSFYKHNSVLLKKTGEIVKAGQPIAITGESGEITTGAHLHFELWHRGAPVNPEDYIIF